MSDTFEAHLTGDDEMAHRFLHRAADAIVRASTLSQQLASIQATLSEVAAARDTLEEIKRNQEERIADLMRLVDRSNWDLNRCSDDLAIRTNERDELRSELAAVHECNGRQASLLDECSETIRARQHDIDLLDRTVAKLEDELGAAQQMVDTWQTKSQLQAEALTDVCDKINAIHAVLGKPPLDPDPREEIEAAAAPQAFVAARTDEGWDPQTPDGAPPIVYLPAS